MTTFARKLKSQGCTWALLGATAVALGTATAPTADAEETGTQNYVQIISTQEVSYTAIVTRGTDAINTKPWGTRGYQTIGSSAGYVGKTVDVTKEQVTDYGVTWAQISMNGETLGWIAKEALKVQTYAQITKETAVDYPATISRGTDAINTAPWGTRGYQTVGSSAGYVGKTVDVSKEQVTDYGVTWAQISLNGEVLGWIAKDALDSQKTYAKIVSETGAYYPATIARGTDAINTAPWGTDGFVTLGTSADYLGSLVNVVREEVTDNGVTWALMYKDAHPIGWVDKAALTVKVYEGDQINRISLSEVQTMVDDISPYFETGISYDRAHIMITGDYMDIYDNYDNNYLWDDYDSSVDQLINAINERGWDGTGEDDGNSFKIYIPINQ